MRTVPGQPAVEAGAAGEPPGELAGQRFHLLQDCAECEEDKTEADLCDWLGQAEEAELLEPDTDSLSCEL